MSQSALVSQQVCIQQLFELFTTLALS